MKANTDWRRAGGEVCRGVRSLWRSSKPFRVILTIAAVYFLLRLAVDVAYLVINIQEYGGRTDLTDYLAGALNFQNRLPLYAPGPLKVWEFYRYSPFFALAFAPFLWVSPVAAMVIHTLLHLPIYALLYLAWGRLFARLHLEKPLGVLAGSLPLWLVFDGFWSDLALLNIYILTVLLATLLLEAVLFERVGGSLIWLSILLQVKPQWAFPLVIPLLFGRWRFFLKLVLLAAGVYLAVMGVVLLSGGPAYALQQYRDYVQMLLHMPGYLPWRTLEQGSLGYNHSLKAVAYFWWGPSLRCGWLGRRVEAAAVSPLGRGRAGLFAQAARPPRLRVAAARAGAGVSVLPGRLPVAGRAVGAVARHRPAGLLAGRNPRPPGAPGGLGAVPALRAARPVAHPERGPLRHGRDPRGCHRHHRPGHLFPGHPAHHRRAVWVVFMALVEKRFGHG